MRKMLSMFLCLAMVLSLAACGNPGADNSTPGTSGPSASQPNETGTPATNAPAGEPKYIADNAAEMTGSVRFLTAFGGAQGTDDLIADFNRYYPNIEVTYEVFVNDAGGNMSANTAIQAGNVDVMMSYGVSNTAFRWSNGMLMDITDRLAADNLDLVAEWGTDAYTYNDRVYYIPCGALSVFIAVNMTAWSEAGLGDLPTSWTWDEYIEACRAMTKRDGSGNPTVYGGTDFNQRYYWTYWMRQTKGVDAYYNAEGMADFDSGLAATILQRELDAEAEGVWYPKINLITNSTKSRDLLWTGEVASCVESIITRFVMNKKDYPHDFILGYAPIPVNEAGQTNYCHGAMPEEGYCVTANAKDPDAAYEFAKFASTYGSKYLYKAGHATSWTGVNPDEIVDLVFGDAETAAQYVDVDSYVANVIAAGAPAYYETNITAYTEIAALVDEYTDYILSRQMTVEDGLAQLNEAANEAIRAAQAG